MAIKLAFLGVIIIWSTTPLGLKWSGEEVGFLFGVTTRMMLGVVISTLVMLALRHTLSLHRQAIRAYIASGIGIYLAMLFGYWSASYIPSGWIAVIWGTSPVFAGVLGSIVLGEKAFTLHRIIGVIAGLTGLAIIFLQGASISENTLLGVVLALIGVLSQVSTAVWIKQIKADLPGIVMTTGGLAVSVPLFIITWWIFDGALPEVIPTRVAWSIIYLALMGSVLGFSLYYYLLNHVEASKVSLITLITPVTALLLGHWLNNEALTLWVFIGTALILSGLVSYQFGGKLFANNVDTS
ncbi:MAG TPA: DMT family transporter [Leucothrix mucor]|nr:DMT family transporter [Leucothrix mucor]